MTLPPDLDAIWRGNPLPPESLILATYHAGREELLDRLATMGAALKSANYRLQKAERERDELHRRITLMRASWKKWCDTQALERYEAMKAARDKYRALAGQGVQIEHQLRVELLKSELERRGTKHACNSMATPDF